MSTLDAQVARPAWRLRTLLRDRVGGPARVRAVVLLACVLALDSADKGTLGAVAPALEHDLGLGHVELGLLATVSSIVGALATIPVGHLTDRVRRVRLLATSVVLWSAATVATGAAGSFGALLVSRLALGAVTATAGPTLASLIGDLFPASERGRMWGLILSGELVGAGIGVVGSGVVAGALSWRWAFWWLVPVSLGLAAAIWRLLAEPERGPADRLTLAAAVRRVLQVRTNVVLIVASSLSYFFFAGVQVFALVLMRARYGLGQASASAMLGLVGLGALAGVVAGGRIADGLMHRGRRTARIGVAVTGNLLAVAALLPALLSRELWLSMPLFVAGAAAMSAGNAPLNAARLDIMPARLWGRAEGVRTLGQMAAVAAAPLLFGLVAQLFGGHREGLAPAFMIMLVPLALGALILRRALRTYPRDADQR